MTKKLAGAKIAMVGLGLSFTDYMLSRIRSDEYDEVWTINGMGGIIMHDRMFMMDPPSRFLDDIKAGSQTLLMKKTLKQHPGPIYSCTKDKRCPGVVEYPLEFVIKETGLAYLNNTSAYAIAMAVAEKVKFIHIFGFDFSYKSAPHFAEAGRACCEFWLATAIAKGIKVEIAHSSALLDTNIPDNEKLYGYHRLKDPLVTKVHEGNLMISKQSKLSPPEPLDPRTPQPALWGRGDIEGLTFQKEKKDAKPRHTNGSG